MRVQVVYYLNKEVQIATFDDMEEVYHYEGWTYVKGRGFITEAQFKDSDIVSIQRSKPFNDSKTVKNEDVMATIKINSRDLANMVLQHLS